MNNSMTFLIKVLNRTGEATTETKIHTLWGPFMSTAEEFVYIHQDVKDLFKNIHLLVREMAQQATCLSRKCEEHIPASMRMSGGSGR